MQTRNNKKISIFLSPHYDDVVFSLGGFIQSKAVNSYIVTIFTGLPPNAEVGGWDKKNGMTSAAESLEIRKNENIESAISLSLEGDDCIDLDFIDNQYREKNTNIYILEENIFKALKNMLVKLNYEKINIDIFAPLYNFHIDHAITQRVALRIENEKLCENLFFYEEIPYVFLPKRIFQSLYKKNKNSNTFRGSIKAQPVFLDRHVFFKKLLAMRKFESQLRGRGKYLILFSSLYAKLKSIIYLHPLMYCEFIFAKNK